MAEFRDNALVLYKAYPARVLKVADRIEIQLRDGETVRVRPKDISPLHPGPLESFGELSPVSGDPTEAWELLAGQTSTLQDLAELIYGDWTPSTAWATWLLVADNTMFTGTPDAIETRSKEDIERERAAREVRAAEAAAWDAFIDRIRHARVLPEDHRLLSDVEAVALGRATGSRVMRELGTTVNVENAHSLLLKLGFWDETNNPYPARMEVPTNTAEITLPDLPDEPRLDLTHLEAYAIDDEGSNDPDDAISLDSDRIWVHVADAGALVTPDSPADIEARKHAANLYLPEGTVHMLPPQATAVLGLGLNPISPALSFGLRLNDMGEIVDTEIALTRVKVTRLTYAEAEARLDDGPFPRLVEITENFFARRRMHQTARLDLPEVKIRVENGEVVIRPLPNLRSRELVTEAMLMAGEAAARFAMKHELPFPYTTQPAPETDPAADSEPQDLAAMYQFRKKFKRSSMKSSPEPHSGLGLEVYSRATSPLRRYLDLVVHQQLRAFLKGEKPLDTNQMLERVGAAESVIGNIQRAERLSNLHWIMVFLRRQPGWKGKAFLVDNQGPKAVALIPELALETKVFIDRDTPLNKELQLRLSHVDLPYLAASFQPE